MASRLVSAWSDLTILLPVKDRVAYTRRWLAYACEHLPCRTLVADGGADDGEVERLVAESRARRLDAEYVRYPFDADYHAYYSKIADALTRVTTPFVVLADDDDLFVPEGLRQSVEFLQQNPDYVACGGQCAIFWLRDRRRPAADASPAIYSNTVEWKCSSRLLTETGDTAEQRLRERCIGAHEVLYVVHRTEQLRRHFAAVRDCNPHDLFLMPQMLMFLTAIAGKTRQLHTLSLARQQDSPGSSGGAHEAKFGDWVDRMMVPTWSDDFARFVEATAAPLAATDGIPIERARRVVIECHKASIAPALLADILEEPTVPFWTPLVLQIVRRLVGMPRDHILRRAAQAIYRRARWLSNDFVLGVEFRTRASDSAARQFAPLRTFLTRGDSAKP